MSTQDVTSQVEFMDNGETTVAVVDEEAYNLSGDDVAFHEIEDGSTLLITADDVYHATYDEDEWMIVSDDVPEFVLEVLDDAEIRYADAEAYGFPVEIDVGFRSDNAVFRSAWQKEKLRPSMDVAQNIQGSIAEVTLTLEVDENGGIVVTDLGLWPDSSQVTVDL